jgi:hypothetical protein
MSEFYRFRGGEIVGGRVERVASYGGAPDLGAAWAARRDIDPEGYDCFDLDGTVHASQLSPIVPEEGLLAAESDYELSLALDDADPDDALDVEGAFPFELVR